MGVPYFVPVLSLAPPEGFVMCDRTPLGAVPAMLETADAWMTVTHKTFADGREIGRVETRHAFRDGRLIGDEPDAIFTPDKDGRRTDGRSLAFVETHYAFDEPATVSTEFMAAKYVVYRGEGRKPFFSDSALKYGNVVIIAQVQAYGRWIEGYPTSTIDLDRDVTESVVLFNPFDKAGVVYVEMVGLPGKLKVRVEPGCGRRVDLREALPPGLRAWRGQVFVTGRARLICLFARHAVSDPTRITTLEHTEPFRGEPCHIPFTRAARMRLGDWLYKRRMRSAPGLPVPQKADPVAP